MNSNRFETSFIPQQPLIEPERPHFGREVVNPALVVALIIFFTTLAVAGGLYYFKVLTNKEVLAASEELKTLESEIRLDTISPYKAMAARLAVAKGLIDNHKAFSIILDLLEESTAVDVGLTNLNYVEDKLNGRLRLSLSGQAASYAVAYHQLEKWRSMSPIVINVSAEPVSLNEFTGTVNFGATLTIDPAATRYAHVVEKGLTEEEDMAPAPSPDQSATVVTPSAGIDTPKPQVATGTAKTAPPIR